jgi:hypothetical protein
MHESTCFFIRSAASLVGVPGSQGPRVDQSSQPDISRSIEVRDIWEAVVIYSFLTLASLAWTLAVKVLPLSTRLGIQRKAKHGAFTRKKCKHFAGIEPKIAG